MNSKYTPPISKYQPVWDSLKSTGECKLTAPPVFHKTIIKGIKHRRDKDTAFLYTLAEQHKEHTIKYKITGSVIHFRLIIKLSIRGL